MLCIWWRDTITVRSKTGDAALLQAKCAELGLGCDIIPEVTVGVSLSALPISAGWWDLDRWSGPWTIWAILTS